ncbi:MAG: metalloregulator ArsR/SmtB family transcription factor [Roseiflexaceae bacterium]
MYMADVIELTSTQSATGCCAPGLAPRISADQAKAIADALVLLGHPIRLQILDMLAQSAGHVCVCDLEAALDVKQPTVSHHLKLMREAKLIDCERRGLWAYYFINHERLSELRTLLLGQIDRL